MVVRQPLPDTNRFSDDRETFIRKRAPVRGTSRIQDLSFDEKVAGDHFYMERGRGRALIFCPGLFGSVDNVWELGVALSSRYRFIVSYLPVYDMPIRDCEIPKLADSLRSFVTEIGVDEAVFIGSSMGGGTLLHYALKAYSGIRGLVLCGSSGLSKLPLQKGFVRRKDLSFVRRQFEEVFFDPSTPSENMIREVYDTVQSYGIIQRAIRFTRSIAKDQLHDRLSRIQVPSLLIWGEHDLIVPPETGALFKKLLPNADLHYIKHCGHVPTQERPKEVLPLIDNFLQKIHYV